VQPVKPGFRVAPELLTLRKGANES